MSFHRPGFGVLGNMHILYNAAVVVFPVVAVPVVVGGVVGIVVVLVVVAAVVVMVVAFVVVCRDSRDRVGTG